MTAKPLTISVVTVCRNAVETIETTVQSVLWQDYPDIEYVVVDGLSTDGTWERLQNYREKIAVLIHEPDRGIYDAMNKGIRRSRGEVIIFMNANDYFISPFVVSRAEAVFRQEPGLDIVYGDYIVDSDEGQRAYRQAERIGASHFLMNRNLLHQSMFIRRRAFERLGVYNEALAITADRDWNIRAFVVERLAYRHLPLVVCMFDKHGASNTQSARSIVEIRGQIDRYYRWPQRLFWRLRLRCLSLRDRSLYRLRHRDFRPPRVMRELPERWARRRSRT